MESSTRTEELERVPTRAEGAAAPLAGAARGASTSVAAGECEALAGEANAVVHPSLVASVREQCADCGAAMAPDQRYCVECGHRRGPARVPVLDSLVGSPPQVSTQPSSPTRVRMSPNSSLIAGVGVLLLALGVGVLIGRSGTSSAKAPPAQVVTIAGGGSGAASTTPASESPRHAAATSSKGAKSAAASQAAVKKATAAKGPPPKTVTVGSAGKGPGYQHGHFTGNFFGPEAEEK